MRRFIASIAGCLLLFPVAAQIPRNAAGHFEYTHSITLPEGQEKGLTERARSFFKLPFLVHWSRVDSIARPSGLLLQASGTIEVRVYHRMKRRVIPVALQVELITEGNHYRYVIHQLEARRQKPGAYFPLELKPETLSDGLYDKLVERTHRYLVLVIGYMRRELEGETGMAGR
ncbi:MAG: hypothetical protein P0Y53_14695 [Candidatus Pseudobacter hemicellulosilyticus]|uniref:DUF4468 domain-containing protein n=1 Tax=Candidatus Pseudobacter hemicellulosilyticus TaxID=3121375 RepID=A0AAJ5WQ79_9BACT|nr:MAG: hypothetical protein P0Y53_14695 [Pseudobacter sp.]